MYSVKNVACRVTSHFSCTAAWLPNIGSVARLPGNEDSPADNLQAILGAFAPVESCIWGQRNSLVSTGITYVRVSSSTEMYLAIAELPAGIEIVVAPSVKAVLIAFLQDRSMRSAGHRVSSEEVAAWISDVKVLQSQDASALLQPGTKTGIRSGGFERLSGEIFRI